MSKPKHFLSVADITPVEFESILQDAVKLKGKWVTTARHKTLALVFEKPSLRTRVSFEVAMRQLGGESLYLSPAEVGLGQRESIADVSRVLSRFVDCMAVRTFAQSNLTEMAKYSSIPIINALSDAEHPCQALADLLTVYEHKGKLKGLTLAYVGDGNNVAASLILACAMNGMNFRIASPSGYTIDNAFVLKAKGYSKKSKSQILLTSNPVEAVSGADVVYTDTWTSMGQESEAKIRRQAFAAYQINAKLMLKAKKDAIIMHCLPAHHGEEVAKGILDSKQSVVFDQAENRLHAQKAVLARLLQ
ncbi:MAG TPA: ornithine carbamoyltransferase [Dehalococcoidales bacterium]|nr:ornithine carbamoyltransferase [Dehalococcoidales bacterium]